MKDDYVIYQPDQVTLGVGEALLIVTLDREDVCVPSSSANTPGGALWLLSCHAPLTLGPTCQGV